MEDTLDDTAVTAANTAVVATADTDTKVMHEKSYLDVIQARFESGDGGGRESLTRMLYVASIPKVIDL